MQFWRDKNKVNRNSITRFRRNSLVGKIDTEKKPRNKFGSYLNKIIILSLVSGLVYLALFSDYFKVNEILVEGNDLVADSKIKEMFPLRQNIFSLKTKQMREKILSEITEIKDVRIIRGIPDAIKIVVLERTPKLVWVSKDIRYLISDQGEVIKELGESEYTDLLTIHDQQNLEIKKGTKIVSPNFIAFIMNLNEQFYEAVNIRITNMELKDTTFDLYVMTDANFYVKFNTLRSSKRQLENLKIVLASKRAEVSQYIDLRIDGWAYYK